MFPLWSDFAGFRFHPDGIMVAVRWYLRYGLSYRDVPTAVERAYLPPTQQRVT
jgi:transposase-like protein